jgi:hypothetical protein
MLKALSLPTTGPQGKRITWITCIGRDGLGRWELGRAARSAGQLGPSTPASCRTS